MPDTKTSFAFPTWWTEAELTRRGHLVLRFLLGVFVGALVLLWQGRQPQWLLLPGMAAVGLLCFAVLLRAPLVHLCVVLCLSVITLSTDPGIQPAEAVYGIYYLAYLAGWMYMRIFIHRRHILKNRADKIFAALLIYITFSSVLTIIFNGSIKSYASEMASLILLAYYFPVRFAISEHPKGIFVAGVIIAFISLFVSVRNISNYQELVAASVLAEYIGGRRVDMNNAVLLLGLSFGIGISVSTKSRAGMLAGGAGLGLLLGAAVITQSRALWVVTLGMSVLAFLLVRPPERRRMLIGGTVLVALLVLLIGLVAGDKAWIVAQSFLRRFSTLGHATTRDISLLSRFYESKAVWQEVLKSPLLGHGLGVPYTQYEIIEQTSLNRTFVHNGYIGLLYRFGVFGFLLGMAAWLTSLYHALHAFRHASAPLVRSFALSCVLFFVAALVYHNTSNLLVNSDGVLVMTLAFAMAVGIDTGQSKPSS